MCVCVYMYMYTHTQIIHIFIYIHTRTHTHMPTNARQHFTYARVFYVCACIQTRIMNSNLFPRLMCVFVYICTYKYTHIIHLYTYTHTHTCRQMSDSQLHPMQAHTSFLYLSIRISYIYIQTYIHTNIHTYKQTIYMHIYILA